MWIRGVAQREFLAARSEMVKAVKRAFDQHDIVIPFPIRTLELHGALEQALLAKSAVKARRGSENGGPRRAS